jgi:peptidyl-dipeptidase Dcp
LALVNAIEQAAAFDRVFSVQLDFLAAAIINMKMHLLADGGPVDALAVEHETLADLIMPPSVHLVMRVPHFHHAFTGDHYAAGIYSYLWVDVMAADTAEAFVEAPDGCYDAEVAARWRDKFLGVGDSVPAAQAFWDFRGRDRDTAALMHRFELVEA